MTCEKCGQPLYYDNIPRDQNGGSVFLLRDERTERTFCPLGGQHRRAK